MAQIPLALCQPALPSPLSIACFGLPHGPAQRPEQPAMTPAQRESLQLSHGSRVALPHRRQTTPAAGPQRYSPSTLNHVSQQGRERTGCTLNRKMRVEAQRLAGGTVGR